MQSPALPLNGKSSTQLSLARCLLHKYNRAQGSAGKAYPIPGHGPGVKVMLCTAAKLEVGLDAGLCVGTLGCYRDALETLRSTGGVMSMG